ncbi:sensor histidine kinase [Jiangella anatolica]|uniref:histidine kinase n=1 Tax=Jiangella anatolica TaxID=2670374 RepID=A0A2W2CEG2_9ACTN|nr:histidine kinase [Jiangella anatolica]PZF86629.1 two-component sensor histidine kinase [Jiangella anatolica]
MTGLVEYAERHPWLTDAIVVAALLGSGVLGVHLVGPGDSRPEDVWVADAVTVVACLAVFGARTHPRATVVVTTVCAVVGGGLGFLLTPLLLAPVMVALYWLAVTTTSRTAWTYGAVTIVLVVGTAVGADIDETVALRSVGPALWLVLPLVMGSRSRLRDALLDAVRARAEHAERTRDDEARLRVTEERMRIARDLHDVVAHHLAVANAQAGTAAHLLRRSPELTQKVLADLQTTTSAVMLELRDTVGVLRNGGADEDGLEPAPGLARLPELIEACASAGLTVDVEVDGEPRELPAGIDLTAYRIVQEALTNATKYSASGSASLRLGYGARLIIAVANETRPGDPGAGRPGYGIVGMRERAHAVGGDLRVSDAGGRFEVVSSLPLHTPAATP